jgi:hypothetical protein
MGLGNIFENSLGNISGRIPVPVFDGNDRVLLIFLLLLWLPLLYIVA